MINIYSFIFIFTFSFLIYADMLIKNNGEKIYCDILNETDSTVFYESDFGELEMPLDSLIEFVLEEENIFNQIVIGYCKGDVKLFQDGEEFDFEYAERLEIGDSIVTGENSRAEIYLYKNDLIILEENTSISIKEYISKNNKKVFSRNIFLGDGKLNCIVRKDYREIKPIEISTPSAIITVSASVSRISYNSENEATILDVINRGGYIGFSSTNTKIGEVVIKKDEHVFLNKKEAMISEIEIDQKIRAELLLVESGVSKKHIRNIKLPRKPIPKQYLYIGAGVLAITGGITAVLLSNSDAIIKEDLTNVPTTELEFTW